MSGKRRLRKWAIGAESAPAIAARPPMSRAARMGRSLQAILIAGPTASGKSALALALAQRLGGVIVNADSMQVYRDLRVITARPTPAEEALAPHVLYGHVDAAERYSAGAWCVDAGAALAAAALAARPAVVGGRTRPF